MAMTVLQRLELALLMRMLPRGLYSNPQRRLTKGQRYLTARYASLLYRLNPKAGMLQLILRYFLIRAEKDRPFASVAFRYGEEDLSNLIRGIHHHTGRKALSFSLSNKEEVVE